MSITHGSCYVNDEINIKYHQHNFEKILKNNNGKVTGANDLNRFCKIDNINQIQLTNCANSIVGKKLDWNWEYFHSGEPAGLHTDYERRYYDTDYKDTIVGIIIPLNWNSRQPYTVNYNKVATEPRKLIYRRGEMRYKDTDEIIDYRGSLNWWDWNYDDEVIKYNPIGSGYLGEYANLKVDSVYKWELGTLMVFDAARWHSSSWFLSSRQIPQSYKTSREYKRAIIGFGSITTKLDRKNKK